MLYLEQGMEAKAMGISFGIIIGVVIGLLTGHLAICLGLGVVFGTLWQGMSEARKAKKPGA
jgi:hypothetical protein